MAYRQSLVERIRQILSRGKGFQEKKMFGGVAFLLNGNMCVGVWNTSLIVRLGAEQRGDALRQPHVKEFDITGRAMKGWVLVAPEGVDEEVQLRDWIQRAVTFVGTLPAK